jgi:hypothetical protein
MRGVAYPTKGWRFWAFRRWNYTRQKPDAAGCPGPLGRRCHRARNRHRRDYEKVIPRLGSSSSHHLRLVPSLQIRFRGTDQTGLYLDPPTKSPPFCSAMDAEFQGPDQV